LWITSPPCAIRGRRAPLPEVLLIVLCGTLAGAQNLVEITQ
jgi:hypothetical protein